VRLLVRILTAADSLESFAERGRILPERSDPEIRELLVAPFRLIYRVRPSGVLILGVVHRRQDFRGVHGS
jgi:plasmid stabilization system protein ParE